MSIDEHRWSAEQERWRGSIDATLEAIEKRMRENTALREDQWRDNAHKFTSVYAKMSDIEKDTDAQIRRVQDKLDRLDVKIGESETTVLNRIAKSEAKLMTMWVIGGGGFLVVLAVVQYYLGNNGGLK